VKRRNLLTVLGNHDLALADDKERVARRSFADEFDPSFDLPHLEPRSDFGTLWPR
jgi:hypothetical protein